MAYEIYSIPEAFVIPDDQLCSQSYWNASQGLTGNASPARLSTNILQLLNRITKQEKQLTEARLMANDLSLELAGAKERIENINAMVGQPVSQEPTGAATYIEENGEDGAKAL